MTKVIHTYQTKGKRPEFPVGYVRELCSLRTQLAGVIKQSTEPNFFLSVDLVSQWFDVLNNMDLDSYAKAPKLLSDPNEENEQKLLETSDE